MKSQDAGRIARLAVLGVGVAVALGGCSGDDGMAEGSSGDGPERDGPTYYGDVAPLMAEHCVTCHQEGGIAPFTLGSYEDVVAVKDLVAVAVESRVMPPFLADGSGACGTYHDSGWLSDEQIATVTDWVRNGVPEGEPTEVPEPPVLDTIEDPDMVLDMGLEYAPGTGKDDDYRCFVVDPELEENTFLTGFEVDPGNEKLVHHVIVYALQEEAQEAELDALDAEEGPGYTCFGSSGVSNAPPVVLWAPGGGAASLPAGTGLELQAGRRLVMQVHYNVAGGGGTDRTKVRLRLSDSAVPAFWVPIADVNMELPPRTSYHQVGASFPLEDLPVSQLRIMGAAPHMHTLGVDMTLELERADGSEPECLMHLPRWDFNWQRSYWYEEPITVREGDQLRITCGYDTTTRNETVYWGDGTSDEMCLNFFYVTL